MYWGCYFALIPGTVGLPVTRVDQAVVHPGVSENFAQHSDAVERMLWHHPLKHKLPLISSTASWPP